MALKAIGSNSLKTTVHAVCMVAAAAVIATPAAAQGGPLDIFGRSERFGANGASQPPVVQAQAGADAQYRIGQLEEQIRALNGRIEELSFQMLQMQEQMRQTREDNEFRFQALEGGGSYDGGGQSGGSFDSGSGNLGGSNSGLPGISPDVTQSTGSGAAGDPSATSEQIGQLIFDQQGQLQDSMPGAAANGSNATQGSQTASLSAGTPDALYGQAYNLVLAGDYPEAESAFEQYISAYPDGGRIADAHFWLGESQFSQGSYNDAARTFLQAHQSFPNAEKAPEMLLKLGMSLAALDNRETACATYREVVSRYPDASQTIMQKLASEQGKAGC